jgi:hypothetical protein
MSTKNSDYTQLRIRKSTNAKLKRYAKLTGETMISVVDLLITAELERYENAHVSLKITTHEHTYFNRLPSVM